MSDTLSLHLPDGTQIWIRGGQLHREDGPAIEFWNGDRMWCRDGLLHRDDGPAIETLEAKEWFKNDQRHRDDGPAVEYAYGRKLWYRNGARLTEEQFRAFQEAAAVPQVLARSVTPLRPIRPIARETLQDAFNTAGSGVPETLPGERVWRDKDGKLHRDDGPAVVSSSGRKLWYRHDKLHRDDGPAIEWEFGRKDWYRNGVPDRLDGPAVEYADGGKEWVRAGKLHREDGPAVEYANGQQEWWLNGIKVTAEDVADLRQRKQREERERLIESESAVMTTGLSNPTAPLRPIRLKK